MLQHLFENIRRGALVLLLVSLLSVFAFAGTKNAPVATSLSAYTSGSSTLITIYSTAPMAYSVSAPTLTSIEPHENRQGPNRSRKKSLTC